MKPKRKEGRKEGTHAAVSGPGRSPRRKRGAEDGKRRRRQRAAAPRRKRDHRNPKAQARPSQPRDRRGTQKSESWPPSPCESAPAVRAASKGKLGPKPTRTNPSGLSPALVRAASGDHAGSMRKRTPARLASTA